MMIKTETDGYLRDDSNHALINNNVSAYKQYVSQRESQNKVRSLESEVDSLKSDITDIKEMLSILIKQTNKEN